MWMVLFGRVMLKSNLQLLMTGQLPGCLYMFFETTEISTEVCLKLMHFGSLKSCSSQTVAFLGFRS